MARIIGCEGLHLAEVMQDDNQGVKFGVPFAVPALVNVTIKDNTSSVTFYSDDTVEQVIPSFAGKEVTVELGYLTNELESQILGTVYENGIAVQTNISNPKNYAMLFKAPKSDGSFQYVCIYKGVFSRTQDAYKGKGEKVAGETVSITGTFMPLVYNGQVSCKADSGDAGNADVIKTWFTTVPQVVVTPAPAPVNPAPNSSAFVEPSHE